MILVLAPYAPVGLSPAPSLGAARKLESVVRVLYRIDQDLVLVNSAHNGRSASWMRRAPQHLGPLDMGGVPLRQLCPPLAAQGTVGKLLNLFDAQAVAGSVLALGRPSLIWVYNPYAFESRLALRLRAACAAPLVLEFEDAMRARGRGFNPKPLIDELAWRRLMPSVDAVFAVNEVLRRAVARWAAPCALLPGLVADPLLQAVDLRSPFADAQVLRVGYFGGLSEEKGADLVLRAIQRAPRGIRWYVGGAGALEDAFAHQAVHCGADLRFLPRLPEAQLFEAVAECDVLLNPHRPIRDLGNGVFPFKVVEAIASGRLLISTALPDAGIPAVLDAVQSFDGTVEDLLQALSGARERYAQHKPSIEAARDRARAGFGESGLESRIRHILESAV